MTLPDSLAARGAGLWLEVAPPRGISGASLLAHLEQLRGRVDAINLTDNALGKVKMSGLVFASMIRSRLQIPVALNLSCRDRNRLALKSELLGAAALGIDAIVALTGDKIAPDDPSGARAVHDLNAFGLLEMIAMLNRGDTGEGKRALKFVPQIFAGAVANPNRANLDREYALLQRKATAGARFVITQPVFDVARAREFCARAAGAGLKVVLGILPVKRAEMAKYLTERVSEMAGAAGQLKRYAALDEKEARRVSLETNLALMRELKSDVAAFNIMSGGGPSLAIELALKFDRERREIAR